MTPGADAEAEADAADRALLARMVGGDREALDALYHRHAGWLTARLEHRCRDRELVDTALQDTFVAAWRSAGRYGGHGDVAAWLWGIAVRRLADELRRRRPAPVDPFAVGEGGQTGFSGAGGLPPARVVTPEEQVLDGGTYGDLADAFRELDGDLQRVLLATAVDGLSTKEAARLLGVPQGTVKTRMMRARAHLRDRLEEPLR